MEPERRLIGSTNLQVKVLCDMKAKTPEEEAAYYELATQLTQEYPGHLPLLLERATRLNSLEDEKRKECLQVWKWPAAYAKTMV